MTEFQKKVYDALCQVPRGRVTTYKALADYIGCKSYRAIGQALKRNPYAPEVPCHRVIASDLTIGGFAGKRTGADIKRKLRLLAEENVFFEKNHLRKDIEIHDFGTCRRVDG